MVIVEVNAAIISALVRWHFLHDAEFHTQSQIKDAVEGVQTRWREAPHSTMMTHERLAPGAPRAVVWSP
jgi:hypothetical protein